MRKPSDVKTVEGTGVDAAASTLHTRSPKRQIAKQNKFLQNRGIVVRSHAINYKPLPQFHRLTPAKHEITNCTSVLLNQESLVVE